MTCSGRALKYAESVSKMIQVETVRDPGNDEAKFKRFREVLQELFPLVHQVCDLWNIDNSLLFRWKGKSRKAVVLMSHQDVVEAPGQWKYPPFSGTIAEGKLWGRGAYDIKGNLHSILCAMEELMQDGFVPAWDVYLASSHEEEPGGNDLIVNFLRKMGVKPEFIVDEGAAVQPCPISSVRQQFISVAVAEKGYLDIKCIAKGRGGHSSAPSKESPLARLAAFICDIESQELFPVKMDKASAEMYRRVAAKVDDFEQRELLRSIAEERPGWQKQLSNKEYAKLHTTVAFTMASGSQAANVIPQEAYVVCNVRVSPGETIDHVLHVLGCVAAQHQVKLEVLYSNEASPITDPGGEPFRRVEQAAKSVWPQYEVLPILLSGCTDTKHFIDLCPDCLRFTALNVSAEQMAAVHGIDENVDIETLAEGVDFFKALIKEL